MEQSLNNAPDIRPDVVERARALISDPSYPSPDTLAAISRRLASGLMSEGQ